MDDLQVIGKSIQRVDIKEKLTGATKFTDDILSPGMLHGKIVTSVYAHAKIKSIDTSEAVLAEGVRAVITGADFPVLTGPLIEDRPPIAIDKVRYYGEAVAVVVADSEYQAKRAAAMIKVEYEPLPVVNSPSQALQSDAPLLHEQVGKHKPQKVNPQPLTNTANLTQIRKGDIKQGWAESEVTVEAEYSFSPSDHAALEPRCTMVQILPDGKVIVYSSSQGPFIIKKLLGRYFHLDRGKIIVHTPMVGGAFGGKAAVQLELIGYLASKAVGGRLVKVANSREEDMVTSPVHIGLDARVKLGATKDGMLKAAEITYLFDGGAYSDAAVIISKAAAEDCTGPYRIDNVWCDSHCMYTNHPYATSFRGFGHSEYTFAIERTIDLLAAKLAIDPAELRMKNAIKPGDTTPTQTILTRSNIGNVAKCLEKAKELIQWQEGQKLQVSDRKVRAKGISLLWKTSSTPPNATSGAIINFNKDGSLNLCIGAVEIGQGIKTTLAQILAERMKMDISRIHVTMEVNSQSHPEHWKTVASTATFMVGRAILEAAEDAIGQLRQIGSIALRCPQEDVDVGQEKVFIKDNPDVYINVKDVCHGYKFPDGNSIGGQVIGSGSFIMRHLTHIDHKTGTGNPGPEWTVGAEAVEVELDTRDCSYRIVRAVSVIDAGKVINPQVAKSVVMGAMSMGLSFASRESFYFDQNGIVRNPQFRDYKLIRFGEQPEYIVEFVETPMIDAPFGARGIGEHGLIGMPAALANSLSLAAGVHLNQLPLIPELIWRKRKEGQP